MANEPERPDAPPVPTDWLVGRDRELATLRAYLDAALAGRGSLVLIGGEAGIGKTALAETLLAEAARRGALTLAGRCYDLTETPPYGPWREALESAPTDDNLPRLPAAVLPTGREGAASPNQDAIMQRVREYLTALADRRPLALLLDDLHWADPASLDLLRVIARHLAALPLLVVATYRDDELVPGHLLYALLPVLVREARAGRLDLRSLDAAAIDALVAARYPLADADRARLVGYLAGRTEGNALFVGELLRTLEAEGLLARSGECWALGDLAAAPVPALLQQIIAGRVGRLPARDGHLLAIATVIGQEVPLDVWAAVSEVEEDGLLETTERAVAARLLAARPDGTSVRFAHALVREALYARLIPPRRRRLHRLTGEALLAGSNPEPDAVANQFRRAGDERAVAWLVQAGFRAWGRRANLTAAERFAEAAALMLGDAMRASERGWLLYLAADLLLPSDRARVFRYLDEIDALGPRAGDPALAAYCLILRGSAHGNQGQLRAAVAVIERGVAAVEALPAEHRRQYGYELAAERAGALLPAGERPAALPAGPATPAGAASHRIMLANWYGWTGRFREARATGEAAVGVPAGGTTLRSGPACWGLSHAYAALGLPAAARHEYALARADFQTRSGPVNVHYCLLAELLHVAIPYQADDLPGRTRLAAAATQAWDRARETAVATLSPSPADLPLALLEGRWDEARRVALAALTGVSGHSHPATAALGILAWCQGDPDEAWARVCALHPDGPGTAPGDCIFPHGIALQALAAELALDAGDLATAGRWIAAHGRWLAWSGAARWEPEHLLLRARLARVTGDATAARDHAAGALARATEPRQPLGLLAAHRLLGELASDDGNHAAAAAHLDTALALADACGAPYERALTLLARAELLLAGGDRAGARATLDATRALLAPLGARPALARADALAARLAAPSPDPVRAALPFGLSAREAEVLRLVAGGLSNPQVADRLSLSRRTVDQHLRAIYGKLGVANRTAAARVAVAHRLA